MASNRTIRGFLKELLGAIAARRRWFLIPMWLVPAVVALEPAARVWSAREGDPSDRAFALLRPDGRLGWRQRERWGGLFYGKHVKLDGRGLRNPPVLQPEPIVIVLGPASTFGWGVREDETYVRRLESYFGTGVLNAGQIGFSSWQGLRLLEDELSALAPKAIVFAFGVNDVEHFRFRSSVAVADAEALPDGRAGRLRAAAWRFALLRRLGRGADELRFRLSCELPAPRARVPPEAFAANVESFIAAARRLKARPVLMTSAHTFPHSDTDAARCDAGYASAERLSREDRCAEAREAFLAARALEPARLSRDLRRYNTLVRAAAAKSGAALVDAERLLKRKHMLDPVHLDAEGHDKLAYALLAALRR